MIDKDQAREVPIETVTQALGLRLASGRRYWCRACNGDGSKTPDLQLYPETGSFYCYKAGTGGDAISLVKHIRGESFSSVMAWYEATFGLATIPQDRRSPAVATRTTRRVPIGDCRASSGVSDDAAEVLQLFFGAGRMEGAGAEYLERRGIDPGEACGLGVRYYDDAKEVLRDLREWVPAESWKSSGLEAFFAFDRLLTFFYFDRSGTIRWAKGRNLGEKDGDQAREWRNLKDQKIPFPYLVWSLSGSSDRDVFLCEGETDAIKQATRGHKAIGVPGADVWRDEWANYLRGWRVFLAGDGDDKGKKLNAAARASLLARRIECFEIEVDEGKDLSDLT